MNTKARQYLNDLGLSDTEIDTWLNSNMTLTQVLDERIRQAQGNNKRIEALAKSKALCYEQELDDTDKEVVLNRISNLT